MATGYLASPSGAHLFYTYRPQSGSKATLVFLNGLSDDTSSWQALLKCLNVPANILRVDLMGQGEALQKDLDSKLKLNYRFGFAEQSQALAQIIDHLQIAKPIDLVGFSYGGGVALDFTRQFPEKVHQLFLWLPFVIRLDQAHPLQRLWGRQIKQMRKLPGPAQLGVKLFENVYGSFLHRYMHHRYQKRIPDNVLREVAVQLSEGIMEYNAFETLNDLPPIPVHLISADKDTLVPKRLYEELWKEMPKKLKKSWLRIEDGEHLILEQAPLFLAKWLDYLLIHEVPTKSQVFNGRAHAVEFIDLKGQVLNL